MEELLRLLDQNARIPTEKMAVMLNMTEAEVDAAIAKAEKEGILRGYKALIDWDRTDRELVTAIIDLQVAPSQDKGFDGIAEQILEFEEVEGLSLLSGGYDLSVTITGRSFKDVAIFVAKRLSPISGVLSTATHFVLKKYKERGVLFTDEKKDERGMI